MIDDQRPAPSHRVWRPGQSISPSAAEAWRWLRYLALQHDEGRGYLAHLDDKLSEIIEQLEKPQVIFRRDDRAWQIGARRFTYVPHPEAMRAAHRAICGKRVRVTGLWKTDNAAREALRRLRRWVREVAEYPLLARALDDLGVKKGFVVYERSEVEILTT